MTTPPPTELVPARAGGLAAAAVGVELLEQVRAEQPLLAGLGDREQLLAAAWLIGYRSLRTRAAYAADYTGWVAWLAQRGVDVLAARRTHVDLWVHQLQTAGAASASIGRRLSALSGFYRHAAAHDLIAHVPTDGVRRPAVDPDHTNTVGLDRAQARALIAAADAAGTPQRIRNAAAIRLLIHNGLRVDEAISANVADLGYDRGHRTLTIVRKGGRRARVALAPATGEAIDTYLHRADSTGVVDPRQLAGPLLVTAGGARLTQSTLWRLVRSLARTAGIPAADQLSPHSLRHTAITLALDAGSPCATSRTTPGTATPAPPAATTTPATASTGTPPTPSPPTSPDLRLQRSRHGRWIIVRRGCGWHSAQPCRGRRGPRLRSRRSPIRSSNNH